MLPLGIALARRPRLIAKLASCALLLIAATPAKAQTPVFFGDTITEPGVYFLAGNQSGTGTGLRIVSHDVTLLLTRYTLRGDGTGPGIHSSNFDDVTIFGGRVTNFQTGILIQNGERCTVQGTRIDHCSGPGLFLRNMIDSSLLRMRVDNNGRDGVEALSVYDSRFLSILAHDNGANGILFGTYIEFGAAGVPNGLLEGNKVKLCWTAYNALAGIRIVDSSDHEIVQNQCVQNGEAGIHLDSFFDTPTASAVQFEPPHDILVKSNWCVFNRDGIVVDNGATSNTLTNNTALANFAHDLVDDNAEPPCANTWFLNFFLFKDGAGEDCIF